VCTVLVTVDRRGSWRPRKPPAIGARSCTARPSDSTATVSLRSNVTAESPPSNTGCTTPPAGPPNPIATVLDTDVELTWIDGSAVEDGYQVEIYTASCCTMALQRVRSLRGGMASRRASAQFDARTNRQSMVGAINCGSSR
jgi:hypothetical protein